MIQVNLLPDVKKEYLHSQQMKHMFTVVSVLTTITAVSVLALLFVYVQVVQPRHRSNLQKDIDSGIAELKKKEDAVKIITVQGVLEQIPGVQDRKMITSELFAYLTNFTPKNVSYSEIKLDLTEKKLSITGQTNSLERANVLANNLKSATFSFTKNEQNESLKPFSNVVFNNLGKNDQDQDRASVSFQITFDFDVSLFDQNISDQKINVNASSEELLLPTSKPFSETSTGAER